MARELHAKTIFFEELEAVHESCVSLSCKYKEWNHPSKVLWTVLCRMTKLIQKAKLHRLAPGTRDYEKYRQYASNKPTKLSGTKQAIYIPNLRKALHTSGFNEISDVHTIP